LWVYLIGFMRSLLLRYCLAALCGVASFSDRIAVWPPLETSDLTRISATVQDCRAGLATISRFPGWWSEPNPSFGGVPHFARGLLCGAAA
jgi:hypothetical protein